MPNADPNAVVLTGENPFLRLSAVDNGTNFSTNASYWRIITCPAGPGHVLYLKSELTADKWRIYSDNIAMARWLQSTVQGMLNAELLDTAIPCVDAQFSKAGDPRYFWTEHVKALGEGLLSNEVNSWMTGINSNVEGKQTRIVARYSGSAPAYRARCDAVAAQGYRELALS